MRTDAPLWVHWVRHGKIDSHRGDTPLTDEGLRQAEEFGRRISEKLVVSEIISFLYAPTRRTRETAYTIYDTLAAYVSAAQVHYQLTVPTVHLAVRNPDIYIAGTRIELVSSAEAVVEQLPPSSLSVEAVTQVPFLQGFWGDADRIAYWVNHPEPPGEDADTVARRLLTFAASLLDLPRERPRRYICVTHSPLLRAFIRRYLLGRDPGEPGYLESVDLSFVPNGSLTVRFREHSKKLDAIQPDERK